MNRLIKIFYLVIYIFFLFLSFQHYHTIDVKSYSVFDAKTNENCGALCDLCLLIHTQFLGEANNYESYTQIYFDLILLDYSQKLNFEYNLHSTRAPPSLSYNS